MENQPVHLVDVRSVDEYRYCHVPGSINLAPQDIPSWVKTVPAGSTIYLICQSGMRSREACNQLALSEAANLVSVEGGLNAFEKAGGQTIKSTGVLPLMRQVQITAGLLVVLGVTLGVWVHPAWLGLTAFVGAGLTFAGVTGFCGMATLLSKMPWNREVKPPVSGSCCS